MRTHIERGEQVVDGEIGVRDSTGAHTTPQLSNGKISSPIIGEQYFVPVMRGQAGC
jgi:hypothetical protein